MADDDDNDSQALTGGDTTRYRALSQDRPDLKFASMQVCCAMAQPSVRDMERVKRTGRYLAGKPQAKCWFRWQQSYELDVCSDADWRGDRATRLKVRTKKLQVVPLSSTEKSAVRRFQGSIRRARDPECGKGLGDIVWAESTPGRLSNNVPAQSQRAGQSEAIRHAELVDTGGFQVGLIHHEEGRHERESSRLDDEAATEIEYRTTDEPHGLGVHDD